jgi:hypothetical protein
MFDVDDHVLGLKSKPKVIKCKYCQLVFTSSNKERWISHLRATCSELPQNVKNLLQSMAKKRKCETVTVLTHSDSGHLLPTDSASQLSTQRSTQQGTILQWVDKTDGALLDELNDQFSSMIYSTGVPFIFADHPKVRQFLQKLKPSWKPPSAKVIAGTLLTKQSTALKAAINTFVTESEYVSLVSDGWSNIRREHMVNYVLVTPNHKPVLLGTEETKELV